MNFNRNGREDGDRSLIVSFYVDAVEDIEATAAAGRPIYKNVEFIRIVVPPAEWAPSGEESITKVTEQHAYRFPQEYATFKAQQSDIADGTPLKMWPVVSPAQVKELSAFGLQTVEQLATLEPRELRLHSWLQPLHEKAALWIKSIEDNGAVLELEAEVVSLREELERVKAENAHLLGELLSARTPAAEKKSTRAK